MVGNWGDEFVIDILNDNVGSDHVTSVGISDGVVDALSRSDVGDVVNFRDGENWSSSDRNSN